MGQVGDTIRRERVSCMKYVIGMIKQEMYELKKKIIEIEVQKEEIPSTNIEVHKQANNQLHIFSKRVLEIGEAIEILESK